MFSRFSSKRDAQRSGHVEIVGLAHEAHRRRVCVGDRGQNVIVFSGHAGAFGHTERGHGRAGFWDLVKERAVGRVGTGPAPFDVIHAQRIKRICDLDFLGR